MAVNVLTVEDITISINGVLVGCAQSGSLELSREELDAVCAASGAWGESSPGRKSWNMSIDALLREATSPDAATNYTFHDAFDDFEAGDVAAIQWKVGSFLYSGNAFSTGLSLAFSASDAQTWTTALKGTGALTKTPVA